MKKLAEAIREGAVIAYPTDTCFGFGANALDEKAIEKVYKIKGRDFKKPLSIIVSSLSMAKKFAKINERKKTYFKKYLPGAYTLIFEKKNLPEILTGGKETIGIRIPDFLFTRLLAKELKIPFTTTSANISGKPPFYSGKEIYNTFKRRKYKPDIVLDVEIPIKPPSKIIDLIGERPKFIARQK